MRRRRRLFRRSTGLWVAALAAVLCLWVTSYYRYRLFSQQGRVLLLVVKGDAETDYWLRVKPPTAGDWRALRPTGSLRVAGVEFVPFTTENRHEYTYYNGPVKSADAVTLRYALLAVPYWLLALVAAVVPLARGVAFVRSRARRASGRCVVCGYDLRATPEGGRCPECGTGRSAQPTVSN